MPTRISAQAMPQFPKLGWWADFDASNDSLSVLHGTSVELGDGFLVEGTWDGDFSLGEFHKSEAFFGSGIRLQHGDVHFVASSAPIDRLFICQDGDHFYASNSLLIMLAQIGATLDPDLDYRRETLSITEGIDSENNRFPIRHKSIEHLTQFICKNAVVSNGSMTYHRRDIPRSFDNFEHYLSELTGTLARIGANFADSYRATSVRPFGTLSTGYDSTAVTCLSREIGVQQCFTYTGSWSKRSISDPAFDAGPIASALGVETISLNSSANQSAVDEQFMQAASRIGAQTKLLPLAAHIERHCSSAVLFTGYYGDIVWGTNHKASAAGRELKRSGVSGLDLSELRLKSGFVNLPVPFIYATNVESILSVSRSKAMAPWQLNTAYNRPIPRRISEEAGVDRHLFGARKSAVFNHANLPTNTSLRLEFADYLQREFGVGKVYLYARLFADKVAGAVLKSLIDIVSKVRVLRSMRLWLRSTQNQMVEGRSPLGFRLNFRTALYQWSVSSAVDHIKSGSLYPNAKFQKRSDKLPKKAQTLTRKAG